GDRRPFVAALVTLDEEALPGWLSEQGMPTDMPLTKACQDPDVHTAVQAAVDEANQAVSKAEAIRKFQILPVDFSIATGHLTPSLKVRRTEVMKEYADEIASIYS
ncbi:MAG: long-chain fatty acid--CoA ligase, partial [Micromonosporaceae bacterium]